MGLTFLHAANFMAILHVRNVPDDLYRRIRSLAESDNRSLTTEVVELLELAVEQHETRRRARTAVEKIRRQAQAVRLPRGWIDSTELLREDRSR